MYRKLAFFLSVIILPHGVNGMKVMSHENERTFWAGGGQSVTMEHATEDAPEGAGETEETETEEAEKAEEPGGKTEEVPKTAGEIEEKKDYDAEKTQETEQTDEATGNERGELTESGREEKDMPVNTEEKEEKKFKEEEKPEEEQEEEPEQMTSMEAECEENGVCNVSFPTNSKAYLDPENLSGKGQIFSDEFKIENYGSTDVVVKIKRIRAYYHSRKELYSLSKEDIDTDSHVKSLNVDMVWRNEEEGMEKTLGIVEGNTDEYVLYLKASRCSGKGKFAGFNKGSTGSFYFTGTMNPDPKWEDGEIMLSFDYEIESVRGKAGAMERIGVLKEEE